MKLSPEQTEQLYFVLLRKVFPERPEEIAAMEERCAANRNAGRSGNGRGGLKQTVDDLLYMVIRKGLTTAERNQMNTSLVARDCPPLHVIEAARKRGFRSILKRRAIRNDDEYYIVKGLLADDEFELSDAERTQFAALYDEYEARPRP